MFVRQVSQYSDLATYEQWWDEHAGGCPFRSWVWQSVWWEHYGEERKLFVIMVFANNDSSSGRLLAILPAYLETSLARGRVLRLLGDGEVCSEHLDLLTSSTHRSEICSLLADYLVEHASDWDAISFTTLDENGSHLRLLIEELAIRDCQIYRSQGANCWSIPLPSTWEEFLAMQSKSHRKQLRHLKGRVLESSRAKWIRAEDSCSFDATWEHLVDLHQRRRQSLGEPGCFASARWSRFHRQVASRLLEAGLLRLSLLELDGNPIAAEYHFSGPDATYAYQGGIDPNRREVEPGQLSMILCIEQAIAEGHRRFELLRGDEPYKQHWRASATPTVDIDIVSPRALARLRSSTWIGIHQAGRLFRRLANSIS